MLSLSYRGGDDLRPRKTRADVEQHKRQRAPFDD
jgi:hypothetical protein